MELELPGERRLEDLVLDPVRAVSPGMLRGTVARVFDDGVIVLEVARAAMQIQLEQSAPMRLAVGSVVAVDARDLEFHPTGV
ncbi:hypothetical protein [Cellulomonas dongxiuzhuiae]|uniref:Transport-associated OB type 2 domain-containing protein n=1 Tax=Cellulomonas dongxiuzhuiae TaxID=2819979 RepID=A0ABX8GJF7_9CELL|nr:hypothetical protein [Cellulomonas dongxiuzhuiae]MBO3087835.1 hypothetical protein [Cellulomonas dongxiuzhuiae]QWC15796.1 hypothetical protein KKR89_16255 [Cellulomonas dongxiuzhuiae]